MLSLHSIQHFPHWMTLEVWALGDPFPSFAHSGTLTPPALLQVSALAPPNSVLKKSPQRDLNLLTCWFLPHPNTHILPAGSFKTLGTDSAIGKETSSLTALAALQVPARTIPEHGIVLGSTAGHKKKKKKDYHVLKQVLFVTNICMWRFILAVQSAKYSLCSVLFNSLIFIYLISAAA